MNDEPNRESETQNPVEDAAPTVPQSHTTGDRAMNFPFDDILPEASQRQQSDAEKKQRKRATKKSYTVDYTSLEGQGEGEAIVETCNDGERFFVEIWLDDDYLGQIK